MLRLAREDFSEPELADLGRQILRQVRRFLGQVLGRVRDLPQIPAAFQYESDFPGDFSEGDAARLDVPCDLLVPVRGFPDVAGDLAGGRGLLFH